MSCYVEQPRDDAAHFNTAGSSELLLPRHQCELRPSALHPASWRPASAAPLARLPAPPPPAPPNPQDTLPAKKHATRRALELVMAHRGSSVSALGQYHVELSAQLSLALAAPPAEGAATGGASNENWVLQVGRGGAEPGRAGAGSGVGGRSVGLSKHACHASARLHSCPCVARRLRRPRRACACTGAAGR